MKGGTNRRMPSAMNAKRRERFDTAGQSDKFGKRKAKETRRDQPRDRRKDEK